MANGSIKITILGSGDGSDSTPKTKKEKSPSDNMLDSVKKLAHPLQSAEDAALDKIKAMSGSHAGGVLAGIGIGAKVLGDAASTLINIATVETNRYFSLREDYISQNKLNNFQKSLNTGKSLLGSLGSGAVSGAMAGLAGGPVGVAIGAVAGGITSLVKTVVGLETQKLQQVEQYNTQLNATNAQTQFMATRASLVNGGRSTEN